MRNTVKVAEYIARAVLQKKGNYMVFFPSYKMLEEVYDIYEKEFSVSWIREAFVRQVQ